MSVEIDLSGASIPGFPNKMEIKNAAQEETLKEILKLMEQQKKIADKSLKALEKSSGTAGTRNKGTDANDKAQADAAKSTNKNIAAMEKMGKGVGMIAVSAMRAAPALNALAIGSAHLAKEFSNLGDSLTSASSALSSIPLVGRLLSATLGAVAGNAEKVLGNFTKLASTGATFDGNLRTMIRSATGAGLTLDQFTGILSQSSQALMFLGGTTEQGAKRFAEMGKAMRTSGLQTELMALGFNTEQINEGMAAYAGTFGKVSNIQNMSTQELTESSASYMKELDVLAKITGVTRQEKQKEMDAIVSDAQYRAFLSGLTAEEQLRAAALIAGLPAGMRSAGMDFIATTTATTEASRHFAAVNPKAAAALAQFGVAARNGVELTEELTNSTADQIRDGARENEATIRFAAQNNTRYKEAAGHQQELMAQDARAREKAIKEQKRTINEFDDVIKQTGLLKQIIAGVGNDFAIELLDDAALASLKTAFTGMADFLKAFVLPIFKITVAILNPFISVIGGLVGIVANVLSPVLNGLADIIRKISGALVGVITPVVEGLRKFTDESEGVVKILIQLAAGLIAYKAAQGIFAAYTFIYQGALQILTGSTTALTVAQKASIGSWKTIGGSVKAIGGYLVTLAGGILKFLAPFGKAAVTMLKSVKIIAVLGKVLSVIMGTLAFVGKGIALAGAIIASPAIAIGLAIAAAAAGVYLVVKHFDRIKTAITSIPGKLKAAFDSVLDSIKNAAKKLNPFNWFKGDDDPAAAAEKQQKKDQEAAEKKQKKEQEAAEKQRKKAEALAEKQQKKDQEAAEKKRKKEEKAEESKKSPGIIQTIKDAFALSNAPRTGSEDEKAGSQSAVPRDPNAPRTNSAQSRLMAENKARMDRLVKEKEAEETKKQQVPHPLGRAKIKPQAETLGTKYTVNGQEVDKETYDKQMAGMDKMTKGLDKVAQSNKHLDETLVESNKLEEDANKKTPQARLSPGTVRPRSAAERAQTPGSPTSEEEVRSGSTQTASQKARARASSAAPSSSTSSSGKSSSGAGATSSGKSSSAAPGSSSSGADAGGSSGAKDAGNFTKTGTSGGDMPTAVGKLAGGGGSMSEQDIKNMIIDHEGIRYKPYKDSLGLWTVGVGHLIGDGKSLPPEFDREFSHDEVMAMFDKDYASHRKAAERIPGFGAMNGRGQGAMTDLTFNMGNAWISKWPNTRKMLEAGDMNGAADALAGSKWAGQVGRRAPIIIDHVRNGIQAAEGGMFSGPKSGYPATLHGDEAVVPLKGGNIPVEMGNANQAEMINLLSTLNNKMEQLVQLNAAIADLNTSQLKAQKRMGNTELLV